MSLRNLSTAGAREPRPAQPEWNPADAFGVGKSGQPSDADLAKALGDFQLPPDLQKMFDQKNQGPR